jgi:hypothetical protein
MCKNNSFDVTSTCAYCLKKIGEEIEVVLPVYDWYSGKLLGYFCKQDYLKVKSQNLSLSYIKEKEKAN